MVLSQTAPARSVLMLTAGSALLLAVSLFPSHSQSYSKADTPPKVAEMLDCIIQPRFQKEAGIFGMERIVTLPGHHTISGVLVAIDKQEIEILQRVSEAHRDFTISFLHCAHVPSKLTSPSGTTKKPAGDVKPSLTTLITQGRPSAYLGTHLSVEERQALQKNWKERQEGLLKFATEALPQLKQGKGVQTTQDRLFVSVRPILASNNSCLSCHAGAKKNELLGAVVYTVSNDVRKVDKSKSQIGSR